MTHVDPISAIAGIVVGFVLSNWFQNFIIKLSMRLLYSDHAKDGIKSLAEKVSKQ